jgi:polyisoprenoid-binding protein YceI
LSPKEVTVALTVVLPEVAAPGTYELRLDRCVIEVAVRVLGRPLLRGRFRANSGTLTVGEPSTLTAVVSAKSLRTNVPMLSRVLTGSRWLCAGRHRTVRFTATVVPDGPARLDILGTVRVRHTEHAVPLRARVVHASDDTVVFAARGVLARDRFPRRLSVEVAAELGT